MMRERFYPDQMTRKGGGKGDLISAKGGTAAMNYMIAIIGGGEG